MTLQAYSVRGYVFENENIVRTENVYVRGSASLLMPTTVPKCKGFNCSMKLQVDQFERLHYFKGGRKRFVIDEVVSLNNYQIFNISEFLWKEKFQISNISGIPMGAKINQPAKRNNRPTTIDEQKTDWISIPRINKKSKECKPFYTNFSLCRDYNVCTDMIL